MPISFKSLSVSVKNISKSTSCSSKILAYLESPISQSRVRRSQCGLAEGMALQPYSIAASLLFTVFTLWPMFPADSCVSSSSHFTGCHRSGSRRDSIPNARSPTLDPELLLIVSTPVCENPPSSSSSSSSSFFQTCKSLFGTEPFDVLTASGLIAPSCWNGASVSTEHGRSIWTNEFHDTLKASSLVSLSSQMNINQIKLIQRPWYDNKYSYQSHEVLLCRSLRLTRTSYNTGTSVSQQSSTSNIHAREGWSFAGIHQL